MLATFLALHQFFILKRDPGKDLSPTILALFKKHMDPFDTVSYLARQEGSRYTFASSLDELVNPRLPYIHVKRDPIQPNRYSVQGFNYQGHDNAPRMTFVERYLTSEVFPHVNTRHNLTGYYSLELHDTYTYLDTDTATHKNCLTFSKHQDHTHVILMPDIFHMSKYGGILDLEDQIPWEKKSDKVAFFGTTTGDRDPLKNQRIQTCLWGADHRDVTDFYITHVAQIPVSVIREKVPNFMNICHQRVPEQHHYNYKYLLNIPGNTCCWNRLPMILNSKSLCFNAPCRDMCFYYPLLHDGTHLVKCKTYDLLQKRTYYQNNPREAQWITQNANAFVQQFLRPNTQIMYMVSLFETMAQQKK